MATVASFELRGLAGVRANLDRLGKELQDKLIVKALRAAIVPVAERVSSTTYGAGRQRRSGALAAGQGTFAKVQANRAFAAIVATRVSLTRPILRLNSVMTSKQKRRKAGTSPYYWWFLESGTRHLSARPWVGPALDATASEALGIFGRTLADLVDEECAKLPKTI